MEASGGDPRENAQNKRKLLGKLLRINPHKHGGKPYRVPRGNPFVGRAGRNEIFALGLRNPFRFSFDRGRILIGDVGQTRWEEVDFEGRKALRGANFGWDHFEGDHRFDYPGDNEAPRPPSATGGRSSSTRTRVELPRAAARSSAATWSERPELGSLRGRYLYADFLPGRPAQLRRPPPPRPARQGPGRPRQPPELLRQGARGGRIYVASLDGPVYKLVRK